jgi:hypothetical protein
MVAIAESDPRTAIAIRVSVEMPGVKRAQIATAARAASAKRLAYTRMSEAERSVMGISL